jgi:5-methylcytosine-specific restriction protein B
LDEGEGNFDVKLKRQLGPASAAAKRTWAEMAWVYSLFPIKMTAHKKRSQVATYWRWSGSELPEKHESLSDSVLAGLGSGGMAYNTHKWREFRLFVTMMADWFELGLSERESLLTDPWEFSRWLDDRQFVTGRMFRHVVLYLLFPDSFEPIASASHKQQIVKALHHSEAAVEDLDLIELDRAVLHVRRMLEEEYPDAEVNFYRSPINERWQQDPDHTTTKPEVPDETLLTADVAATWFGKKFPDSGRVWWLSTGTGGRTWPDLLKEGIALLNHGDLGDLAEYRSHDVMREELVKLGLGRNPKHRSLALWQFSRVMQVNDLIIAQYGGLHIVGWGFVRADYTYDADRPEYPHSRAVEWHACNPPIIAPHRSIAKALTDFTPYMPFVHQVFSRIDQGGGGPRPQPDPTYTIDTALEGVFVSRDQFHRILESIRLRRNLILQGPPGTGKTFIARRIAWCLIGQKKPDQVEQVQFHQSYSYEDFVQGYRPTASGGFSLKNGVFFEFCQRAKEKPDEIFVFIIDEINRGNLSRIFGELLMLMESDKRGSEYALKLTYSSDDERFFVPPNVYILGMMNTADRSLALVDYALRRRFAFEELIPAFGTDSFRDYLQEIGLDQSLIDTIDERMEVLNEQIRDDNELGRGFQIGHSFFVPGDDDELSDDWYKNVVRTQIQPLLQEYWFDAPERVEGAVNRLLKP